MKKILFCILLFFHCIPIDCHEETTPIRILVGSPIRQKPAILQEFLESLHRAKKISFSMDYFFINDNDQPASTELLQDFAQNQEGNCFLVTPDSIETSPAFICDKNKHYWNEALIWKVAHFKDRMIQYALDKDYDYLFLIDSDLVLHPETIEQLLSAKKEIISNVFWTCWYPGTPFLPQVWLSDEYIQYQVQRGEALSPTEITERQEAFLKMLKKPGTYEVGGLGACTLLSRSALEKGVSFQKIKNLTFWGEDRHFCIRAAALGIKLFVDTHYPAYHIYRESYLEGVDAFIQSCKKIPKQPRITLSMIMRNEAKRYLRPMLESAREYITDAVIIDDASTDNSVELCRNILQGIPLTIIQNESSKFSNEVELRKQQWEETIKTNPDWILNLDTDEIFENAFKYEVKKLISNPDVDAYYFRLFDFWDKSCYREDHWWFAHQHFQCLLVRYKPEIGYEWKETPLHCGRFPITVYHFQGARSQMRLKHFGWARPEDREKKYLRYKESDPLGTYGHLGQYESILDPHPNLVEWIE